MSKTIDDPKESLEHFQKACESLALSFMHHRFGTDPEEESNLEPYILGKDGEYFIGNDFGVFSDGSDYYHWTLSEMYSILDKGIPYEIAAEHKDWSIENEAKPEGWVNLEYYAMKRKWNATMEPKEFWRMLTRERYLQMAENLTDKHIEETERQMKEMKDRFIKENFPGS